LDRNWPRSTKPAKTATAGHAHQECFSNIVSLVRKQQNLSGMLLENVLKKSETLRPENRF
jgi:hypothetical protein